MKTKYQVQSKLKGKFDDWQDDHMPFDSEQEAINYIITQPRCFSYRITTYEEPETSAEWLEFNDALDAIGGDWEG